MDYILKAENLTKIYGHHKALDNFSMHIPQGAIYGLVGRNGAGKTTLLRIICGLQEATFGDYSLYGISSRKHEILNARKEMGAVIETPAIYLDMSATGNLKEQYRVLGLRSFDTIPQLLKMVGLEDTGRKKAKNFSLGMRQRLGIAIALVGNPSFLVLDEPINGLDPQGIIEMRQLLLNLNQQYGITILVSSHILDELSRLATHYGFIDNGKMIKEISADDLENSFRKSIRIEVTDGKALAAVLKQTGQPYKMSAPNVAEIYHSVLFSLSYTVGVFVIGNMNGGELITETGTIFLCMISSLMISVTFASIMTLLAILNTNKAGNVVVSMILALVLLVSGSFIHQKLGEPKLYDNYVTVNEMGIPTQIEQLPNPQYIEGTPRIVLEVLSDLLPSGQAIQLADAFDTEGMTDESIANAPYRWMGYSLLVTFLTSVLGIALFRKREIR